MTIQELDIEPVPGLPENLPDGETIVWQGKPDWWGLALRVFHIRKIAVYFAVLLAWWCATTVYDGGDARAVLDVLINTVPYAALGIAILTVIAQSYARTTIYTITTRRVVMRFGVALPIAFNIPFCRIESASLRQCGDGTGDLPLKLVGKDKIAFLHLWPFVRPGQYRKPQPTLRALKDPEHVARLLADAMKKELGAGEVHRLEKASRPTGASSDVDTGLAAATR